LLGCSVARLLGWSAASGVETARGIGGSLIASVERVTMS
jgi:hypothetical protein